MKVIDVAAWENLKSISKASTYIRAIVEYMERWVNLMEKELALPANAGDGNGNETIKRIYLPSSHEADIDGITGFMFSLAVDMLAKHWIYGEALRVAHNAHFGYFGEGTVNSAVLSIV